MTNEKTFDKKEIFILDLDRGGISILLKQLFFITTCKEDFYHRETKETIHPARPVN